MDEKKFEWRLELRVGIWLLIKVKEFQKEETALAVLGGGDVNRPFEKLLEGPLCGVMMCL